MEAAVGGATQARLCLTAGHAACPFVTGALTAGDADGEPRQVVKPEYLSRRPTALLRPLSPARYRGGGYFLAGAVLILGLVAGLMAAVPRLADGRMPTAVQRPSLVPGPQGESVAAVTLLSPTSVPPVVTPVPSPSTPTVTPVPPTPTSTVSPTATPTFTPIPTWTATPTPLRPPAVSPPTQLVISSLGVDIPVVEVGWETVGEGEAAKEVWVVADYAASFHRTSAYPGRPGNTVISGHNNIRGEVFRDLQELVEGDEIVVYVGQTAYPYQVAEVHILSDKWVSEEQKRENAKWIGYFPEERLTLVTCWPYEGNSHRVIVVARPLAPQQP